MHYEYRRITHPMDATHGSSIAVCGAMLCGGTGGRGCNRYARGLRHPERLARCEGQCDARCRARDGSVGAPRFIDESAWGNGSHAHHGPAAAAHGAFVQHVPC